MSEPEAQVPQIPEVPTAPQDAPPPMPASWKPGESLYGEGAGSAPPVPKAKAPGLVDQVVGLFTEPTALFRRLAVAPAWGGALGIFVASNLALMLVWSRRVDVDAMFRPIMEANPRLTAEQIDAAIALQARIMPWMAPMGALLGVPFVLLLLAGLYWLLGLALGEDGSPSFERCFSAAAVSSLVMVPNMLLALAMCLTRPVGGLRPDVLVPTSLGFWVHPASAKLGVLVTFLEPFTLASVVLAWLAGRHLLRLRVLGAGLCAAIPLVVVAFRVAVAK